MDRTKPPGSSTSYSVRSTMTRPCGVTGRCATARSCSTSSVVSVGWRAAWRSGLSQADARLGRRSGARARTRRIIVFIGLALSMKFSLFWFFGFSRACAARLRPPAAWGRSKPPLNVRLVCRGLRIGEENAI